MLRSDVYTSDQDQVLPPEGLLRGLRMFNDWAANPMCPPRSLPR